ncbi:YeeE/YedE family protein [Stenotrophomonas sp. PD6]|uniref:YeeE/YedE family protein n=1 Tax=Stenotrophomonas sp. PD6 TaxID=3368612 RepID=UPI003BA201FD
MSADDLAWYWPLLGGVMIGAAAGAYLLLLGRIAGISGLLASACGGAGGGNKGVARWFVIGLFAGGAVALAFKPVALPPLSSATWHLVVLAGVLVGYGARLGSGCTSGHGVCGMARLSPRSVLATAVFMMAGMLTVFAARQVLGGGP